MTAPRRTLDVRLESWKLRAPVAISGHVFTAVGVAVITLREDGFVGRGEAAGVYFRDDRPELFVEQIGAVANHVESGCSRDDLMALLPSGGARNALDCAMWDLEASLAGKPVWSLAGLEEPRPLESLQTLSGDEPHETARAAARIEGTKLKLKLIGDGADADRICAVRLARPDAWLCVDANQGLDRESFARLRPVFAEAEIAMIEQPFPIGEDWPIAGYEGRIPVFADESALDADDLPALVGRYHGVSIKLDKCGGLTAALMMAREARRLGLMTMVGNMSGTSLAAAPAYLLGQTCDIVDLDGPLLLAEDRKPSIRNANGRIECPASLWGSGCSMRELEPA